MRLFRASYNLPRFIDNGPIKFLLNFNIGKSQKFMLNPDLLTPEM